MPSKNEGLGIFGALATVLIIIGVVALIANYFGVLPGYN